MRTARIGIDAAIVTAATENAPTADGFKNFSAGAVTDATLALAKPAIGVYAATDNAAAVYWSKIECCLASGLMRG